MPTEMDLLDKKTAKLCNIQWVAGNICVKNCVRAHYYPSGPGSPTWTFINSLLSILPPPFFFLLFLLSIRIYLAKCIFGIEMSGYTETITELSTVAHAVMLLYPAWGLGPICLDKLSLAWEAGKWGCLSMVYSLVDVWKQAVLLWNVVGSSAWWLAMWEKAGEEKCACECAHTHMHTRAHFSLLGSLPA